MMKKMARTMAFALSIGVITQPSKADNQESLMSKEKPEIFLDRRIETLTEKQRDEFETCLGDFFCRRNIEEFECEGSILSKLKQEDPSKAADEDFKNFHLPTKRLPHCSVYDFYNNQVEIFIKRWQENFQKGFITEYTEYVGYLYGISQILAFQCIDEAIAYNKGVQEDLNKCRSQSNVCYNSFLLTDQQTQECYDKVTVKGFYVEVSEQ